ncbi:MAG: ATP-binding protein, partial [Bacteroidales bacterium]
QQICDYPEKNTEALLRTIMQENPQIRFIFSGSDKHMMEGIFAVTNRPFYQSVEMMYLGPVPAASYREFIRGHFSDAHYTIADVEIDDILSWCRNHTFYIQYFCNRLFDRAAPVINREILHLISLEILSSYEPLYLSYQRLLTDHQFSLLRAIAVENGVARPLSGDFISKYHLKGASSVKTSLVSLSGKQMLIEIDKVWVVYDVFFARWLEHTWRLVNIWKA